jgi:hypothetical protein
VWGGGRVRLLRESHHSSSRVVTVNLSLQATSNGFGLVNQDNVFRVCDQPHPVLVGSVVKHCLDARIDDAYEGLRVSPARLNLGD